MTAVIKRFYRTAKSRNEHRDQRGFWADAEDQGLPAQTDTSIRPEAIVPDEIATLLEVEQGARVLARQRHHSVNGVPVQLSVTWFTPEAVQAAPQVAEHDTGKGGYLSRFEDAGFTWEQPSSLVSARVATNSEIAALQLDDPVVLREIMIVRDTPSGTVLAITEVLLRHGCELVF